ncbi:DUF4397 domain-containing protein [Asinibacterium sp. OR53]|uniref:DUF4397 domain-containing protein n=1 Tax=Asinibacterium sp. OR53 TaxID=925409 RepID=UPI00047A4F09|nr:DUF4397 domain-containing protein [Asinibacterium sp. OR53]
MKTFSFSRIFLAIVTLFVIGMTASSCTKSLNNHDTAQTALLMAFNLAPDKPAAGFLLSGNSLTYNPLPFAGYTGAYVNIYSGTRTVVAYDFSNNTNIDTATRTFSPGKYYSMFLTGIGGKYKNVLVQDEVDSLSGANGQAYIRYINAIPDSTYPTVSIIANGSAIVQENAAFQSISGFVAAAPGQASINISNKTQTINASRTITLEAKKVYTLLFIGAPNQADSTKAVQIRYISNGQL